MARFIFRLPDVGEGTTEAEIIKWYVAPGESVSEDAPLVDVATDKAVVEIPSPVSGTVISLHGAAGDTVAVGTELVVLETSEQDKGEPTGERASASVSPIRPDKNARAANVVPLAAVPPNANGPKPAASPAVRRRARELEVDLKQVAGSAPGARISHADLDAHLARRDGLAPAAKSFAGDGVEEHKLLGVRRRIAVHMQEAKRHIPHFSYIEEVDMTALEELRRHLNEKHARARPKLSLLPFLIKAITRAAASHPEVNARFDDGKDVVARYRALHIGIATQTPNGLLVPVLRSAQERDLWDCAAEILRLASAAREGKSTREELSGSTISITSLGALGGLATTPIINYPEVAIVGVNKLVERPVVRGGRIVARSMMNLSSSFDHRVVDGASAAAFIQEVRERLEQPTTLFLP